MSVTPAGVPTIESDRLILRAFVPADVEPMIDFYGSDVSRFYGGPCSPEEAWRKLAMYPGHWALRGFGPWAVEEKSSGAFVGIAGMWFPEGWHAPEITWALIESHHGKGFATEAAARALRSAYEDFGWSTAVSVIAHGNEASVAVARRLGATFDEQITNRYGPADVYRHAPPDAGPDTSSSSRRGSAQPESVTSRSVSAHWPDSVVCADTDERDWPVASAP